MMGVENIDELKPAPQLEREAMNKFVIERFPDGEHEVPLTLGEGGPVVGVAEVTIENGQMTVLGRFNEEGFKTLGLDISYYSVRDPINGDSNAVVASFSPGIPREENPDGT
jgi:hypothetical protein